MINFEKELKNFQPSLEVEEAEAAIYNHDLTDVTDIITEILRDVRQGFGCIYGGQGFAESQLSLYFPYGK